MYDYLVAVFLMMGALYVVIAHGNLVKKVIGLGMFSTAVFILYITLGKVEGGSAPILDEGVTVYSNPLPHALILTAIVVGVATTAVGLSLAVRIKAAYGTVEEDEITALDHQADEASDGPGEDES
ncbi:MAG: cation:proton antiporter subunit C [Planctomycetota bacterium]|jgi:multicomponent Na+:H+ antiporter subunit C